MSGQSLQVKGVQRSNRDPAVEENVFALGNLRGFPQNRSSGHATPNMPLWYTDYFEQKALAKQQM